MERTQLLIIGAGPFGLSLAAYAAHLGIDYRIHGRPMGFWKEHMPTGMYLRSACDWHLDPLNEATIERYLETLDKSTEEVEPISLEFYLNYTQWFQEEKGIHADPVFVAQLDYHPQSAAPYHARLADGRTLLAERVAVAIGFQYFKHMPPEFEQHIPASHRAHTCDLVDFSSLQGKRCLILGGRQSAFEWAALLREAGAAAIHVVHRHPTPAFTLSDWSWVNPLVDQMAEQPGVFRDLTPEERKEAEHRLWVEGRLKLEPWLEPRIKAEEVLIWSEREVAGCQPGPGGSLIVELNRGEKLPVDQVILATGYKPNMARVPFLAAGNILPQLAMRDGCPELDRHMQTNLPGLFVTSMAASRDFGPFFNFTVSVRTSAKLIGRGLRGAVSGQW